MQFNLAIFKVINGFAHHNMLLDKVMIIMSEYVPYIFMISLVVIYINGVIKNNNKIRGICIDTILITAINLFIGYLIGMFWYVPRPFVNNRVNLLMPHTIDASFPSDHAMGTMGIAIGINKYSKKYGLIFMLLSVLVGISRVYVGHHYPIDVLGGYAIVFITSFLYNRFLKIRMQNIYFKIEGMLLNRFFKFEQPL